MTVEAASISGRQAPKELVRSIDWRGAFWVASGVPTPIRILQRKDGEDEIDLRLVEYRGV